MGTVVSGLVEGAAGIVSSLAGFISDNPEAVRQVGHLAGQFARQKAQQDMVLALRAGMDDLAGGSEQENIRVNRFAASELARLASSLGELGRNQRELRETQASLVEARRQAEAPSAWWS